MKTPTYQLSTSRSGFSLVELLVSMGIFSVISAFLLIILSSAGDVVLKSDTRVRSYQTGRDCLELFGREVKGAMASSRQQFAICKSDILGDGDPNGFGYVPLVAKGSHAAFWVAPIGDAGELAEVGYYLYRDDTERRYQLKRLHVPQTNENETGIPSPNSRFPNITINQGENAQANIDSLTEDRRSAYRPSPSYVNWLLTKLDPVVFDDLDPANDDVLVSTLADGVLAFWIQPIDQQGNPIPSLDEIPTSVQHPPIVQPILFNSAAYWTQANSATFDDGKTFLYTSDNVSSIDSRARGLMAQRVPAALDIAIVTAPPQALDLIDPNDIPTQDAVTIMTDISGADSPNGNTIDIHASTDALGSELLSLNVKDFRTFSTRVRLLNGTR